MSKVGRAIAVLDRVELLAGQIEPLLQLFCSGAPELTLIVTSRVRLQVPNALELGPLPTGAAARVPRSTPPAIVQGTDGELSDAARLLLERARNGLPGLPAVAALGHETRSALEHIAAVLDGIPLAIELAAARAGLLGWSGLEQRLTAQLELLAGAGGRGGSEAMRDAIGWSFALLRPEERNAFMQCALFRDGFTPEAAEAVLAAPDGAPQTLELLALAARAVAARIAAGGLGRAAGTALHVRRDPRVRARTARRACVRAALAAAALRHARYYAALAAELVPLAQQGTTSRRSCEARA